MAKETTVKVFRLLAILAFLVGSASLSHAQLCPGMTTAIPVGFQALTVSTAAVGFTVPDRAEMVVASQELADVRLRDDGTNPTASVGVLSIAGNPIYICGGSVMSVRFIRAAGTDALISAIFYRR